MRASSFIIGFSLILSQIAVSQNLIVNGGFKEGFSKWKNLTVNGAKATFSIDTTDEHKGGKAMSAEISVLGSNSWDAQSIHSGWASEKDQEYTLQFWGKASNAGESVRIVMQKSTFVSYDFEMTTDWEMYEVSFVAQEDSLQLKIHFFEIGSFLSNDFSITRVGENGDKGKLTFVINPIIKHQEMVGFGGSMAWYCDRVTSSAKKDEITNLLFDELGLDILRLKNWYYPKGYPAITSTDEMEVSWFKKHFDASKELYSIAKNINPGIKVLLSSWGPPSALKSNGALEEGTLKKNNDAFMYDEFVQYNVDVLDSIGFEPDWFGIQNEQGFTTSGWTTCEWRPSESVDYPSFITAFNGVYNEIKYRPNKPLLLGGESENIGTAAWNKSLNAFSAFANELKGNEGLFAYGFHLYNYYNSGIKVSNKSLLNMIRDDFEDKPSIMTEFSSTDIDWSSMANVIQTTILESNAIGYVYWQLMWDENATNAIVQVKSDGSYTVTGYYYLLKHFAKYVSEGDIRIELKGSSASVKGTAYLTNKGGNITIILTNNSFLDENIELNLTIGGFTEYTVFQSTEGDYYKKVLVTAIDSIKVPAKSIITINAKYDVNSSSVETENKDNFMVYPNLIQGI